MSSDIGSKFEDFIILKIVNHGKYGFVAKVKSKKNNNIYSMKKIDLNLIQTKSTIKYYNNEYDFVGKLDHKNVYKSLSCFKENNNIYIITKYMDGGNLTDLYNWYKENTNQKIEEKRLLKIFIQCLRGLKYIHEKNIIHRYLIQDTIIFDSKDQVKIINFKYATEKDKNNNEKVDIGVLTAPEMKNKENYDEKVDVYSLGMIFSSLAYLSSKLPPEEKRIYSKKLYEAIKKIKKGKNERPTSKESYLDFINIYYFPIKAYLKSFLHCLGKFKQELLKLEAKEIKQTSITYKIKALMDIKDDTFISEASNTLIESFSENGIDITNIKPNEFIELILLKMHKENKDKHEINIQIDKSDRNQKIENEIRKEKSIKENDKKIKDNKSFISENFLVTRIDIKECPHCKNSYNKTYFFKNENFIKINGDKIEQEKGNIKKIFENLITDKKDIPPEHCDICGEKVIKNIETKFYKLSKYLIILIDKGFQLKNNEMKNLNIINLGKKEVESFISEHQYELISILTEKDGIYNYYCRKDGKLFCKNNEEKNTSGETVHRLEEISENIITLYYYCEDKNINSSNNDDDKTSQYTSNTSQQSNNAQNQDLSRQEILINNNFLLNNFENNNNNKERNFAFRNDVSVFGSNNIKIISFPKKNNVFFIRFYKIYIIN